MRLATRTGWAALGAVAVSLLAVGAAFRGQFDAVLRERVDAQLEDRAQTAPILAAIAPRLAQSELRTVLEGARVDTGRQVIELGILPGDPLPPQITPGWSTVRADGERWRLYTVEVRDVPEAGDRALVQLAAPLGDVDARASALRRRAVLVFLAVSVGAGLIGAWFGRFAARPLAALRRDTERIRQDDPSTWAVAPGYGSPDVDDVATALNANLARLATETRRRGEALDSARAFAASATHELRTPLQGALTNLDLARSDRIADAERHEVLDLAAGQLRRMASSLGAVRALADAEFADASTFEPFDLAEVTDAAVAEEARRTGLPIRLTADAPTTVVGWRDGVGLAVANLIRNAADHGTPPDGSPPVIHVHVTGHRVTVDDAGPGVPPADRERVLRRFERGGGNGSGLGLAIAQQVAVAHGGRVEVGTGPLGGARVTLVLAPSAPG